jgi:hypothetical protein
MSSISEKQSMFFNWYHKVIVKYKYFRKSFSLEALEAAGSGSNLGFNYSHLGQGGVDGGCDLRMNCSAWNN